MLGAHVIFGAYGFWLPNDPRGSWSEFVGSWDLYGHGPATKTTVRHSVAHAPHDTHSRLAAKTDLKYPAVRFTGRQALAVGQGFGEFVRRTGLTVWACAILPDHVHLVLARFRYDIEQLVNHLKGAATRQLVRTHQHPLAGFPHTGNRPPKAFARGEWKVFLDTPGEITRSIRYVEQNPIKDHLPPQRWSFVQPYHPTQSSRPA